MFKYLWILLIAAPYVFWSYKSIKNIIEEYLERKPYFDFSKNVEFYTEAWAIVSTSIVIFIGLASLVVFIASLV